MPDVFTVFLNKDDDDDDDDDTATRWGGGGGWGGGYSQNLRIGVWRQGSQTLTLFKGRK